MMGCCKRVDGGMLAVLIWLGVVVVIVVVVGLRKDVQGVLDVGCGLDGLDVRVGGFLGACGWVVIGGG